MLSRNKLLLSLVVPTVAVFIFAILWRRKNTDTPSSENKQENMARESQGNGNETSKQQSETPCSESRITSNVQHEKENGEQVNLDVDSESQHINGQNINEIDLEEQEDMDEEDICAELEYDNNGDPKELETTSDSKMICDRQEGKKTSWSTIDSGVELTKQPSFELKDYWLGEETLSEGSGDSVALSGYTEPPLENYLASGCEMTETEKTVWEVEFPQILCGRLIGRKGKNVKVISDCSGAKIRLIPQSPGEVSTHRIISISGECSQIKSALDSIHEKFPAVSLNRINTTASLMQQSLISSVVPTLPIATPVPYVQTVLPNITNFSVVVTSVLDGNHFFIQLHNDALQAQLQQLHQTMLQCYGQGSGGPLALPLSNPIIVGSYCAAPAFTYDGWYRAQVLGPTGNGDEVQVKYLDYGGYGRIAASSLRQLRSDFLSYLPFQAVECYLSNVAPLNGDGFSLVASAVLEDLTMNSVLTARVVGHRNQLPCLELYLVQGQQTIMINRELVNRGLARWVESRSVLVT